MLQVLNTAGVGLMFNKSIFVFLFLAGQNVSVELAEEELGV